MSTLSSNERRRFIRPCRTNPDFFGEFQLIKNAGGVPGLHVARNLLSESAHAKLFSAGFDQPDLEMWPLRDRKTHEVSNTLYRINRSPFGGVGFPDDWFKLINAVKSCGLWPMVAPNNAYGLIYRPGEGTH